jgi:hypothetical protein
MSPFNSLFLSIVLLLVVRCNGLTFDRTCSRLNQYGITRAYNDMVAMAQVAYDRTVAASEMRSPPGERRVVTNTFNTYFGVTPADGRQYRLSNIIGRRF